MEYGLHRCDRAEREGCLGISILARAEAFWGGILGEMVERGEGAG